MTISSNRQRNFKSLLLTVALSLFTASCGNAFSLCLPTGEAGGLESDTIRLADWTKMIGDSIRVRVVVANDQEGNLAPQAIFTDNANQRVAVLPLLQFLSSPVHVVWVDDETSKTLPDGQLYTTIHAIGYVSPELYPGRKLDSIQFLFQPQEAKPNFFQDIFSRLSVFQDGVLWFPATSIDFENHKYLGLLRVDSEESLATDAAIHGPTTYSEWQEKYEPAINIEDRLIKLSQLDWVNIDKETECVALK